MLPHVVLAWYTTRGFVKLPLDGTVTRAKTNIPDLRIVWLNKMARVSPNLVKWKYGPPLAHLAPVFPRKLRGEIRPMIY